ncbi:potassium/proton antiporter [Evansella sp. AB-P1]|uniref:potassium/proton antiporter n=1 Tax=Evansella sp. AB-P1 TaxID=3037653 RepID=UPI00241BF1C4|nr:potassium/proton antiporter [Evansella sp. AB-P1]MDG5786333.1 potassium/proton antiporter [Evansella sp. AB-P1]
MDITYDATTIILFIAFFLILGVLTTKFSSRIGVPALVLFIGIGILMGSDILGFIYFDNPKIAQFIGIFALILILFEGGLQTKWENVKSVTAPSLTLATVGVLFTAIIVGIGAKYIIGFTWIEAFLFGSIVGSTDAAAVFSVLRGKNIKKRLEGTLEVESGTNDPMAVFLTITFIGMYTATTINTTTVVLSFFWQMGIGLIVGYLIGKIAIYSINKINLDSSGLYPVFAAAFAILAYSSTSLIQASGFLAVYVTALMMGNNDLPYRQSIFRFHEGFAWMMQMIMFIILGLFVFPGQLINGTLIIQGTLLSIILMLFARPISVFISLHFYPFNWKEKLFLSWAGLRGAVPIILATFPMIAGVGNSQLVFNLVFFIVVTSTLLQGATIPLLAKNLKLTQPAKTTPEHVIELSSIGKTNAEIVEFFIDKNNLNTEKFIVDLPLPKNVLINAIIRKKELIPPHGKTKIYAGDTLFVLVKKEDLPLAKKIILAERQKTNQQ